MAKAASWTNTDDQVRKRGEQTGLDTLVVHALNDDNWMSGGFAFRCRSYRVKLSAWEVRPQG